MPAINAKPVAPRRSAVSDVLLSGYDLKKRRKPTGKLATMRDYAKMDWKPWPCEPGMKLARCSLPAEQWTGSA
jgi:hypothetical protein